MFKIKLKNNKTFTCDKNATIFEGAQKNNILLEYSCLSARCRSCKVKVLSGYVKNKEEDLVLTKEEKNASFVLSCNSIPLSDLELDIEEISRIQIFEKKIVPSKICCIEKLTHDVFKIVLRLPPKADFRYNAGQYVNIIRGNLVRSYSIANHSKQGNQLEFYIKKYNNGLMSDYFFNTAKINDLLRIEGPLGTFFLRDSNLKNIVLLATGTGIAPIKSILEGIEESNEHFQKKTIWLFVGARYKEDLIWEPNLKNLKINYLPVLSRQINNWDGSKGYIQDEVLKHNIDLGHSQVYACGSSNMINDAKELFIKNKLNENNFFSDAFVQSN